MAVTLIYWLEKTLVLVSYSTGMGQTYIKKSICAVKGSSVDISCSYNSYENDVRSKFWFSLKQSDRWWDSSQPEDLSGDAEFAGRVQLFEESGRSTLRITELRESDSAEYRFKFKTSKNFEWRSSLPGTTLTVTDLQVEVTKVTGSQVELKCRGICRSADHPSYVWYKNGEKIEEGASSSYRGNFNPDDRYSCAVKGHEGFRSPSVCEFPPQSGDSRHTPTHPPKHTHMHTYTVCPLTFLPLTHGYSASVTFRLLTSNNYAPKVPSVSVSPSGEIVEGSSVTLTCSSDANPAATYTWYKKNGNPDQEPFRTGPQLNFVSIQSSDSGEFYCTAQNELGEKTSDSTSTDSFVLLMQRDACSLFSPDSKKQFCWQMINKLLSHTRSNQRMTSVFITLALA
uniref:Ig-like domain-containing protein n=1 Tax=Myripristis murdjan TaxID=586833 RepID=A0A667WHY5_9TELE